jgi:hypothetical protein
LFIYIFIFLKQLSRPELVRKLWDYIKKNNLQDPADRRFILCDDKLKKIFNQDRVNSFGMNKDLTAHLTKKEEPITGPEETSETSTITTAAETNPSSCTAIIDSKDDIAAGCVHNSSNSGGNTVSTVTADTNTTTTAPSTTPTVATPTAPSTSAATPPLSTTTITTITEPGTSDIKFEPI